MGEGSAFWRPARRSTRSPRAMPAFAGLSYDATRPARRVIARARCGSDRMTHSDRAAAGRHARLRSRTSAPFLVFTLLKMIVVFTVYMVGVALLTLAERKISAWIQDRHGPNRVGQGLASAGADGVKNFMKEETYPAAAYMPLFVLAPALSFIPALVTWAVIPFAAPWDSPWGTHRDGARAAADRLPVHPRDLVARRLRHRARRLGVEQQVRAARRPALERADDLVRDRDGHVHDSGAAARRQRHAERRS